MRKSFWVAAVLASAPVWATTMLALDLAALTRSSDAVVHGRVARVESRWTGDKLRIVTDAEIEVIDAVKGEVGKTVRLVSPGGVVGDIGQKVHGSPNFTRGEEVVVFLEARPGGTFLVTGMSQGKFRVERSSDGRAAFAVPESDVDAMLVDPLTGQPVPRRTQAMKLDELKNRVRQLTYTAPQENGAPTLPGKRVQ